MHVRKIFIGLILTVVLPVLCANSATILLADGSASLTPYVVSRLEGLGHTVTVSSPSTWGSSFDYSLYDVVAFSYDTVNPADVNHFTDAVLGGTVGTLFFRGQGAEATAYALGLVSDTSSLTYQNPATVTILDNTHAITDGLSLGSLSLGFTYMSSIASPGANTTVLATGPNNAALVVHNTLRAAILPFYGHTSGYDNETAGSLQITSQAIEWAAAVPEPASILMLVFGGIFLRLIGNFYRRA